MNVSKQAAEAARLMKQGLLKEAVREFERALAQDPADAAALLGLARLHLSRGNNDAARPLLKKLVELHPGHAEAHSHLARLDAEAGDAQALARLKALAGRPEAGFFELLNYGRALLARQSFPEAAAAFEHVLRLQPGNHQVLTYLGMAQQGQGQLDQALRSFLDSAAHTQREHLPLVFASRVLVKQGRIGRALVLLRQALTRAPGDVSLYPEFIKLSLFAGAPKPAVKAAIEFRMRSPKDPDAAYLHGLATLLSGNLGDAERILRETLALAPNSIEVRVAMAKARRMAKDDAGAQKLLEEALKLEPHAPDPVNELAVLHMSKPGGAAKAREVLAPALAAHPEDAGLNLNMALALADSEKSRAREYARKAQGSPDKRIREQAEKLLASLSA
ncbi:tetratricopeptide repeat protein [Archangium lansingense]|uniref:Tetratricopeptide repeat protein n=1 Tax=Archangium lansingense TaxID=2995310 RepID=A0ABT4AGK8_9BACT|nr:tetratricopeptide repeat protein [Archangium lansinium]MCY1080818.1 tetratricopeptide repeat protein [Archangium lansinium]